MNFDNDNEISELKRAVAVAEAALSAAKTALHAAKCSRLNIAVGDIVRRRSTGHLFQVTEINPDYGPHGWVSGHPQRKTDGNFSPTLVRDLFDAWEKA